ncbi:lysophospholipid acyltransferase family protein [Mangrovicoccus sp. HB161399]|uniref:lysophospholipid acyltransferase family protein n=1 Tax=Mangrovicoccus sp. HB161399 TaxID=2720392 RepID=UPI0015581553|nr:lysophospholipid acyltransferase family protein [Mangrovicoccus sp. HB161399]
MGRISRGDRQRRRDIARDISYASSAGSPGGRALIRVMENATGRIKLIRRADGYEREVAEGRDFWEVMAERYGLSLRIVGGGLGNIPARGPVVVIANHPFGILDGLMMGLILRRARGDFRILANQVFRRAEDLQQAILPISFDETKEAVKLNLETRRLALGHLGQGGAMGVFPGGTVSTALRPFSQPMDPGWRSFTARMIAKSGAAVVPVFFVGHNSRFFQLASHLHQNLRLGLLIKEFKARVNRPVDVVIGTPVPREMMAPFLGDARAMMDFLREQTYRLSPTPVKSMGYGFEFEEKHRN